MSRVGTGESAQQIAVKGFQASNNRAAKQLSCYKAWKREVAVILFGILVDQGDICSYTNGPRAGKKMGAWQTMASARRRRAISNRLGNGVMSVFAVWRYAAAQNKRSAAGSKMNDSAYQHQQRHDM